MKRVQILIVAFVVVCLIAIIGIAFLAAKKDVSSIYSASTMSAAVNKFAFDFYRVMDDSMKDKNFVYSPFSISAAYAILLAGSRGDTMTHLYKAMSYNESVRRGQVYYQVAEAFQPLLEYFEKVNDSDYTMIYASKLVIQQYFDVKTKFKKAAVVNMKASFESSDFIKNGAKITDRINQWIANKTKNKISKLFQDPFDENTKMVIANAVYFHAKWMKQFNKNETVKRPFFNTPSLVNATEFMNIQTGLPYYNHTEKRFALLELEYRGNVSFYVVLPNDIVEDSLQTLMANLTVKDIEVAMNSTKIRDVNLFLPKFKFESVFDLKNSTEAMGAKEIYEKPDFTGITPSAQLRVSKAVHKTVIDVNEEGTEAAAATGLEITGRSFRPVKLFDANRPFMFFIRNKVTGLIYFMGAAQHF